MTHADVTSPMKPCLVGEENIIENIMTIVNEVMMPVTELWSFTVIRQFQLLKDVSVKCKFCFWHSTVG